METRLEFQTVILAALLHDIGKFLMRGRDLPVEVKGRHPEVSRDFVSSFADSFKPATDVDLLKTLVRHHHQAEIDALPDPRQRLLAHLIGKADRLSAGERGQRASQYQDYKTMPLASVFPRVFASSDPRPVANYHPGGLTAPKALSKELLFPADFAEYRPGELEKALTEFGHRARPLLKSLGQDFNVLISHLLSLLAAHAWAIPSDTQEEVPDISLYDHMRTTAAIAACLYESYESRDAWEEAKSDEPAGEPFCLLVGDVSGIQRYVFDIASVERSGGGVAKRLRARSLYVQLISEVVPLQLLALFSLPPTNVLMASGGKFYLLVPNLPDTQQRLERFQERVDQWFLHILRGELGLNLAWVPCAEAEMGRRFGDVLSRAMRQLDGRKEQGFQRSLVAGGAWQADSFLLPPFGGGQRPCRSCGMFPAPESEDPSNEICDLCKQDKEWGERLPKCDYLSMSAMRVAGERELLDGSVGLHSSLTGWRGSPTHILSLNNPDTRDAVTFPASFRYLVQHIPRNERGDVLDFEDIATNRDGGRPYLAFLKADVDNLGEVLAFGLKGCGTAASDTSLAECPSCQEKHERWDTISRLATLSRMLDLFFTGWVERLLEVDFPDCYAVFSGGDDLFLVGPWDRIIELAGRLRGDFADYTSHNPRLTLSAGIFIAPHHYPISQAAHEAEDAVERSKDQKEKNSLTLLGHPLAWPEWGKVKGDWEALKKEEASSALLYSLLEYGEMWRDYQKWVRTGGKEGSVLGLRFQPLLAYNLGRNVDPRRNPALHPWAQKLVEWRPGDAPTEATLDSLGLLAQLLILGKGGET